MGVGIGIAIGAGAGAGIGAAIPGLGAGHHFEAFYVKFGMLTSNENFPPAKK